MAKLEFYRQQVVPNLTAPSGAGIAEAGRSRGQAIQAVKQLTSTAADMFAELDAIKAEDAFNKIREQQTTLMTDPEQGFMSKKAGDAVSADFMRKYMDDFDRTIEETYSGLQNQRQRDLFRRRADAANTQYRSALRNHVLNETESYNKQVFEGTVKNESATAAANYKDLPSVGLSLENARNSAIAYANRAGLKGDAQIAFINGSMAAVHDAVLSSAIGDNNFPYVKDYLKTFEKGGSREGELPAARVAQIKQQIETSDVRDQSLKLSIDLVGKGLSTKEQRAQVKDMYTSGKISAEVYDQTVIRINQEEARAKAAEADFNNSMSGQAQEWILTNPGKSVLDMPPRLYNWAKSKGQLDTLNRFADNNGQVRGNSAEFTRLYVMGADDPTAFIKEFDSRSNELQTELSKTEYNSLLTRRGSIGKADLQGQQASKVAASTVRSLRNNLIAAGLDITPKEGTPQAEQLANFEAQLIQAIEVKTQEAGRALTLNESRKIGLDLLREGRLIDAGSFWGDKGVRRFEATEADIQRYGFRYNYEDIPPEDQKRLYRLIQTRPDLREQLGITLTPNKTITSADFARGIEVLYSAEVDGVNF
jgi:hypothetical protein